MKERFIKLVALFEVIFGLAGLNLALGALIGWFPYAALSTGWYGIFPLISIVAGVLLWFGWNRSMEFSLIVQLLQVPFIKIEDFLLNLGGPINLTISGIWLSQDGGKPTELGINFLAVAIYMILQWCRRASQPLAVIAQEQTKTEPPQEISPDSNQENKLLDR